MPLITLQSVDYSVGGPLLLERVDLAIELRELGVRSVPVNLLNPIRGTPFEDRPVLPPEQVRLQPVRRPPQRRPLRS